MTKLFEGRFDKYKNTISYVRRSCLFLLIVFVSNVTFAQISMHYGTEEIQSKYPKYITFLPSDKLDSVLVYANTDIVPVIYKVNKYDLQPNAQLDSIVKLIDRIILDPQVQIAYVWIGGSASPEGPVWWNRKLGDYRSSALAKYLLSHCNISKDKVRVENLVEDWYSIYRRIESIDFPHKDFILQTISNEPDWDKRKQKIKSIDKGKTWWKLIKEVFPPYRNGRMVIVCSAEYKGMTLTPIKSLIPLTIPTPSVNERMYASPFELKSPENRFYAIKTNALFLAALCANIGFEAELWRHWSIDLPIWYSPYDIRKPDRKIRLLATQPELRWWPGKAGEGFFVGPHAHLVGFNIALNDHGRYQDPNRALWGFGIGLGYALNLGAEKRWAIEFNIGAGYANYVYDTYRNWKNGYKFESNIHDHYWGITRAGINIAYKWYKQRKKWRTAK
jgi:hypothetical protein